MSQTEAPVSDSIAERRAAVLDFIAASIFSDRDEGIRLAARIVAEPALAPGQAPDKTGYPIRGDK